MPKNLQNKTIRETIKSATKKLHVCKIENPKNNAEQISAHYLNKQKIELFLEDNLITDTTLKKISVAVKKRSQGVPLQYITTQTEFYNCQLQVNPHVLIPRPETEYMCEIAIKVIQNKYKHKKKIVKILDFCTGSGAIAIVLAKNIANSKIIGADISVQALQVAQKNANQNQVPNIAFLGSDRLEALLPAGARFDVMISNPPYISKDEIAKLPREVLCEPLLALNGGIDGMDFYRYIIKKARTILCKNALLFLEIHEDRAQDLIKLARKFDIKKCDLFKDYCQKDRVLMLEV
jgi:release factor glutamine methyltransferase